MLEKGNLSDETDVGNNPRNDGELEERHRKRGSVNSDNKNKDHNDRNDRNTNKTNPVKHNKIIYKYSKEKRGKKKETRNVKRNTR